MSRKQAAARWRSSLVIHVDAHSIITANGAAMEHPIVGSPRFNRRPCTGDVRAQGVGAHAFADNEFARRRDIAHTPGD